MKVSIIGSRGIPARYGGFEVVAEKLAQGLSQEGHNVFVYSLSEFKKMDYIQPKIKRVFVTAPKFSFIEKVWMSNFSTLHSVLKEKVNAIIFLGVSGGLTMWVPKIFSTKSVVNIDGLEWKRSRWNKLIQFSLKILESLAVRWADDVIADSKAIGEYVVSQYKKTFVFIPYGVDECTFEEKDWNEIKQNYGLESGGYYLIVGRHVPENNFEMSISGFLKSKSSKKLVIVSNFKGEGKSQSERVIFTGPIYDRHKLFALRANSFVYIHGHSVGGTNPSLLEAMSSKNIIFSYDVPYNREVLEEFGYYFKNESDLKDLIIFFEKNFDKINTKTTLEYYDKILKEKYNWDIVINKYKDLLH